jgi:hypothetical protein
MAELLRVERYVFNPSWTLSRYYVNNELHGFGVEDEIRVGKKIKGETAIPFGSYTLGLRQSPRFSKTFYYHDDKNQLLPAKDYNALADKKGWRTHDLIWLLNVPKFEYVLIHWGNTDKDTDGCYIVGNKIGIINGREGVLQSRDNYRKLYTKIYTHIKAGGKQITIGQAQPIA